MSFSRCLEDNALLCLEGELPVTFYHNGCPKCKVLKKKLDKKQVDYSEETDSEILISKGFKSVPVLEVDGKVLNFMDAVNWVNRR